MEKVLHFNEPAQEWTEGLMLGNGHMGCVLYGGIEKERIDLSEITFFSGERSRENNQKCGYEKFKEMRKHVAENNYEKAMEVANGFIGVRHNYGTNLPVGRIEIDYNMPESEEEDYHRHLNIIDGIADVAYRVGEVRYQREAFVSHPSKQLIYQIKADKSKQVSCSIRFCREDDSYTISAEDQAYSFQVEAKEKIHSDGESGTVLWGNIRVNQIGGTISYTQKGIHIEGADQMIMSVKMNTDFGLNSVQGKDVWENETPISYEKERKIHCADVSSYMKRVDIQLNEDEKSELMFQYGRYLLLSSSREDSPLPTHLQGVWNDNVACRIGWTCDMHLDINTQMNYWLAGPGNLPECREPLFRWMEDELIPSGRITAKESYGMGGWSADLVSNAWGFSAPYWSRTISPCPTGGIWMASDYWEQYQHTGDEEFLRNHAYPVLEEAVEFFLDYVFWDENTSYYSSGPSISPENSFAIDGKKYHFSNGCTYEILMIRELLTAYLKAAYILKKKTQRLERANEVLEGLLPYRILNDGSLAEWNHDYPATDLQHRHTSHLLGLYPYSQITPEKTPELSEAVRKSIELKLQPYEKWEDTGWARSLLILYMSRLKDGEGSYRHMKAMQEDLTQSNLLVMHPPTRGAASFKEVYELDGNTGFSMGVIEVLLQSHDDVLQLLPALPKQWRNGHVRGLVARGAVEVSLVWANGHLSKAEFVSKETKKIAVVYGAIQYELDLVSGKRTGMRFEG